jgi:DNA-binding IclR family transcriptional regulator
VPRAAKKAPPAPRPRGDAARQTAQALRLLAIEPQRPSDLMRALGTGRRSVERMLRGIEAGGWKVETERRGREVWYSVTETTP